MTENVNPKIDDAKENCETAPQHTGKEAGNIFDGNRCAEDAAFTDAENCMKEALDSAEPTVPVKEEYEPIGRYDAVLYRIYKDYTVSKMLQILSYVCVLLTVYVFVYNIVMLFPYYRMQAVRYITVCAVPFVLVSILRKLINAPRPYEQLPFYEVPPKNKRGEGFPSRHVFSIFVIASCLAFENILLGVGLAALGVLLAVCRVLLGMHFIRDTVAGAAIGIVSGVSGVFISGLFF